MNHKRTINVFAVLSFSLAAASVYAQDTFNGSTYEVIVASGIGWDDAETAAENAGGGEVCYLATITSDAENMFVDGLRQTADLGEVWLGGFQDPITETVAVDGWTWVNGEGPFPGNNSGPVFANWFDGEPNDNYGPGSEQHLSMGLQGPGSWNDEGTTSSTGVGNIDGYVVECEVILPGENVTIFPVNIPNQPVVSVVQEVVEAGQINQYSCVIKEPKRRKHWKPLNLIRQIKKTPGCEAVAAQLLPYYRASLRSYQRAFVNPLNTTDRNKKDIVVTLVKSTNLFGEPADLTRGVVISEDIASTLNVSDQECRLVSSPPQKSVESNISPSTVRVNVSGGEVSGRYATNSTMVCNRPRNASRYSDQLYAYPIRNASSGHFGRLQRSLQVASEAASIRRTIRAYRGVCVDTAYLNRLQNDFISAMAYVQFGNSTQKEHGIDMLEDTSILALDPDSEGFSYDGCTDLQGQLASRLLAITFQSHRYILFPDEGDEAYVVPQDIRDLLPPFPGDPPPPLPIP